MNYRCNTITCKDWHLYGGRGIKICPRWKTFENFLEDMGLPPTAKHMLERLDNERGYSPKNCRWALPLDQANNTRRTIQLEFNGKTLPLQVWCRKLGLKAKTVDDRIRLCGWSVKKALTTPTNGYMRGITHYRAKPITFRGITQTKLAWAKAVGISSALLSYRLKHDWSIEKALTLPPTYSNHHQA